MKPDMEAGMVFVPQEAAEPAGGASRALARMSVPPDAFHEGRRRLRLLALLLALLFAVGNFVAPLLAGRLDAVLESPQGWLAGAISIGVALLMFAVASIGRIPDGIVLNLGLVWEVVACAGIAVAQYWGIDRAIEFAPGVWGGYGLSWVAPWVLVFTIVVPSPPGKALIAAALSLSLPIAVLRLSMIHAGTPPPPDAARFLLAVVVPYLLVLGTTYVAARIVYRLGKDVAHARALGSYRLTERLGSGGLGEVWRASHRLLARPAAIRLVRPESIGQPGSERAIADRQRFEREAQTTAELSSPHTVSLYDFGVTGDGTFYYVMELVHGLDLDRLVDRFGPVAPARVAHILRQTCESLAEAHARGLVHRDIKPANIYLCRVGGRADFVKVLDFGLFKRDHSSAGLESRLTRTRATHGTPAYLPPEMARSSNVDARADLYALGCVAYWLLTGSLVFEGPSHFDMVSQHMREAPVPPSRRTSQVIPAELEAIVLGCLEKDPDRRPASAGELERRLAAVRFAEPWTHDRAETWWDAHLAEQPAVPGERSG